MADREVIIPPGMEASYERLHFAPAVRDRDRLYCSGQLGTGADGKISDDPEAQFAPAFENVKAVRAKAGADFGDSLEMTTYHVDLQSHIRAFMTAKELLDLQCERPFRPLRIFISDGESYEVRHPEMMLVTKTRVVIALPNGGVLPG